MNQLLNFKNVLDESIDLDKWMPQEQQARIANVGVFLEPFMSMVLGIGEKGFSTPWDGLKGKFEFREQELTVWSGYKGHGKSLVISQVFEHFLINQQKCMIISPEFPPHRVLYRMMQQTVGTKNIDAETAWEWLGAVEKHLWLYNQQSSLTPIQVIAICRYAIETKRVQHILIDSLMKCGIPPDDYGAQKRFVDTLQQIAHRNKVHIHLVAHARKAGNDHQIGSIHDIKGTSEIGDMVENVLIVWRNKPKEFDPSGKEQEPDCILKVEAQRNADGWIGTLPLFFRKEFFTFTDGSL
jgi:twinkle protein